MMKRAITLPMLLLLSLTMLGQTNTDNLQENVQSLLSQRTPLLEQLYQEAKSLELNGTPAEINANRLAIKAAWHQIDPEIASLYKPVDAGGRLAETVENLVINGTYQATQLRERDERPGQTRDWDEDRLLLDDWVDGGVDIEVTADGDIYISAFQNDIENEGATFDQIYIFRSLDGGMTFEEWQVADVTAPMRKMQLISLDGTGDEYLVAYILTASETFQAWRWNMDTGAFDAQAISGDVSDFGVDRNYPVNTNTQRVFATYQKTTSCTEIHSARSTAGSYGFDWVDEVTESSTCGEQVDIAYGLNGAIYTTYTGAASGNLYANVNDDYNDPASWIGRETVETGGVQESVNPTIIAARKAFASDEVLLLTSSRNTGATTGYNHLGYIRENGAAFTNFFTGIALPNQSIAHMDTWVRKDNASEEIRTSYIVDIIDESENNRSQSFFYDGTDLTINETVSDSNIDVWNEFPAAVAETNDDLPCMAFAGTSGGGGFGYGLYFDAKAVILGADEHTISGLTYYPNPVQDRLHIDAQENIEKISVFNVLGQEVLSILPNTTRATVDTSTFAKGMYVVQVASNGATGSYKIIKK
jgi:hypothetical protein